MMPLSPHTIEMIGFGAAMLTTYAFVPQMFRIVKLRSAKEISLGTFSIYGVGVLLWLVYGVSKGSMPMILSNSASLLLSIGILILKIKYDHPGTKKELGS